MTSQTKKSIVKVLETDTVMEEGDQNSHHKHYGMVMLGYTIGGFGSSCSGPCVRREGAGC